MWWVMTLRRTERAFWGARNQIAAGRFGRVARPGTMANFAPDVFQARNVRHRGPARAIVAGDVAADAFEVEFLVVARERFVGPGVRRRTPDLVFLLVARRAAGVPDIAAFTFGRRSRRSIL